MEELNTQYKLKTRTIISNEYNEFLYSLYLPLIGHQAVFLYSFLCANYQYGHKDFTLKDIVKDSGLSLQDFIFERKMLESIGLISTFKNEDKVILIINAIYSPKNFFNDDVLKGLFINQVGKEKAMKIIKHYEIDDDTEDYIEVTSSITDNFSINFDFDNLKIGEDVKLASTNKVSRVDNFDDVKLISYIKKNTNIKESAISPDELKKIHDTGVLFSLDEKIMSQILVDSFEPMNIFGEKVNFDVVNRRAKSEVVVKKSYKKLRGKKETLEITNDTDIKTKIDFYKSMSPRDFLKSKQDGVEPVRSDLDIITYLSENMDFSYDVINVILDYTLKNTNNQLNRAYIEKIAASLKRNKVTNCLDAITKLYSDKTKKAKTLTTQPKDDKIEVSDIVVNDDDDLDDLF